MLIRSCIAEASAQFDVPVALILGPCRNREQSQARHAAMWLAHIHGHVTPKIGRVMGRDPSTVHHGIRRAMEWARSDQRYCKCLVAAVRALWVQDVAGRIPEGGGAG